MNSEVIYSSVISRRTEEIRFTCDTYNEAYIEELSRMASLFGDINGAQ